MAWLRRVLVLSNTTTTTRGFRSSRPSPCPLLPTARLLSASSWTAADRQRLQPSLDSANLQAFSTEAPGPTKKKLKKLKKPEGGTKGSNRFMVQDWRHGISPKAVALVEQILRSQDEKKAIWKELDLWVESQGEISIAYVKQALHALKQKKHWSRVIQVSEWMLQRGEGKTLRTYEVLLQALDMQKYATEAERLWKNDILKSSWSIPSRLVSYALDMFDRHQKPLEVIKLFIDMERSGRKFDKPSIVKVSKAYEQQGFLAMKEELLAKYNLVSPHDRKEMKKELV